MADFTREELLQIVRNARKLRGADLKHLDLSGADLRKANLMGADLRMVNLSGSDLREADLREAQLFRANLRAVYLTGAKYNLRTIWRKGFDPVAAGAVLVYD